MDLNTARRETQGRAGVETAALCFGNAGATAITEQWNGSAWTELNDLNAGRTAMAGFGLTTAAIGCGGEAPSLTAATEDWNGAAWVETSDMSTARSRLVGAGISTSGVISGGSTPSATGATEEWSGSSSTIKVLTD